jgi:hypothetical protein
MKFVVLRRPKSYIYEEIKNAQQAGIFSGSGKGLDQENLTRAEIKS